jgi:hypothetical protein
MKVLYLALSLLPTAAVLTLGWYVVRAITVRVVWRAPQERRVRAVRRRTAELDRAA